MTGQSISNQRLRAIDLVDRMPSSQRDLVHEFGVGIVDACRQAGVTRPSAVRELVYEIWGGARQPSQRRGPIGTLDWLLIQAGADVNVRQLIGLLEDSNFVVTPTEPTREMLAASMAEVSGFNIRCSREEKHRRRLRAALRAAMGRYR